MSATTIANTCLTPGRVAVLAAFSTFLFVATACELGFAQGRAPRRPVGPTDRTRPEMVPEAEPDKAEPEEGAPEKEYKTMPVDEAAKKNTSAVNQMLTEGKFDGGQGQKQMFDDFYRNYFLARWSRAKGPKGEITNFPKERRDFRNQLGKRSVGGPAVHDHLNELALEILKTLTGEEFHPAVRVNAMLMIGDLNSVEAASGEKAVPLPEALKYLVARATDTKISDGVRAAAMVGAMRHAVVGIRDPDTRKELTTAMLPLASADLPVGPAAPGRGWIRAQAIEILGALGSVGENNAVFQTMSKTVADDKLPILVRNAAADSLGLLNYSSANGINALETATTLGEYAVDACDDALAAAKKPNATVSRRRMLQHLTAVLSALDGGEDANRKGVASLAKEASQQASLAKLRKLIEDTRDALDNKLDEPKDMKNNVVGLQTKLKSWLQEKPK